MLAGRSAEKMGSILDAIDLISKRINCLEKMVQTPIVQKKTIDARIALAFQHSALGHPKGAMDAIVPVVDMAENLKYSKRLPHMNIIRGFYCFVYEGNNQAATTHLELALESAKKRNDNFLLSNLHFYLGFLGYLSCDFRNSMINLQRLFDINSKAGILWGVVQAKAHICYGILNMQGELTRALETGVEAVKNAEESADNLSNTVSNVAYGATLYYKGMFKESEIYLKNGVEFSEKCMHYLWGSSANYYLGEIYSETSNYDKASEYYHIAISCLEKIEVMPSFANFIKIAKERAEVLNNKKNIDIKHIYELESKNKVKLHSGLNQRYIAEILLHIDDSHLCESEHWIQKAIKSDNHKRNETVSRKRLFPV